MAPCIGSWADDVSGDGMTVAGMSFSRDVPGYGCVTEAFRVTPHDVMVGLGFRDAENAAHRRLNESEAKAVSFDGSVVAGESNARGPTTIRKLARGYGAKKRKH